MKIVYTLLLSLFALVFASCKKDTISHFNDYTISYHSWTVFKDSSHNSYRYMVANGSWTGYGSETIITVREGKVVGRSYVAKRTIHNGTAVVTTVLDEWTETESQLSAHDRGAAAVTLDKIYETARQDWLQKRDDASTYFETNNRGMISSCGYVPDGCQDDCFRGITISFIEAI
jgi:hypothetical protein